MFLSSHSHNDEEDAVKCAGWLKSEFGLDPFIEFLCLGATRITY